jgi:hypothetical protein
MESASPEKSALATRRLLPAVALDTPNREVDAGDLLIDAPGVESLASFSAGVVLETGDEARAATLLASGASVVFLGEAALRDSTIIERLATAYGSDSVGIYAPARRQAVSWSFETASNADFKTVAPSVCEPAWEVLKADGAATGTLLPWWLSAMRDLGATQFLVRADIRDDTDLNICAGLVETFGDQLWLGPLKDAAPQLDDWIAYGQCRQLVLPPDLFARFAQAEVQGDSPCHA